MPSGIHATGHVSASYVDPAAAWVGSAVASGAQNRKPGSTMMSGVAYESGIGPYSLLLSVPAGVPDELVDELVDAARRPVRAGAGVSANGLSATACSSAASRSVR